jgi:hypothetical protein
VHRERTLLAVALGVAVLSALALFGLPGAIASHDEPVRSGHVDVAEVTIESGPVTGATATLHVTSYVRHRGGPTENVTVVVRAVDAETGFLETSTTASRDRLTGDRETAFNQSITVERSGGYRIETILYADGERVDQRAHQVGGVESLTPDYAESAVEFHRFGTDAGALPTIQYGIADVGNGTATLNVSTYLTNRGDEPSGDLRVVLTARQSDSNIVADRTTVRVGDVRPGRTATPSATLTVPDEYNYYLDAVLWKDGVVVGSTRSAANLHPTETLDADVTQREVGLEVSDFEEGGGGADAPPPRGEDATSTPAVGPGFGVVAFALALLALSGLLATRRHFHE